jgi:hypothetical protein
MLCSGFSALPRPRSSFGIGSRSQSASCAQVSHLCPPAAALHAAALHAAALHAAALHAATLHCWCPCSVLLSTMPKASRTRPSAVLKTLQPRNSDFEEELGSWLWLYELYDTEELACNGIVRMYLLRHPECNPSAFDYYPADYYCHLATTEHHRHYNEWFQVRLVFYSDPSMC